MGREVSVTAKSSYGPSGQAEAVVGLNLAISQETDAAIERLSHEIGGTKTDVFAWALALLTLAMEARKKGKRIAIVDQEGHIDTEIGLQQSAELGHGG